MYFRDAPLDIWEWGLEFLLLADVFFTSKRKQSFFWQSTCDNFFLMFRRRNFLSYIFTFSTNFFFLTFVATNYFFNFFLGPPPPIYQMVPPLAMTFPPICILLRDLQHSLTCLCVISIYIWINIVGSIRISVAVIII